METNFLSTAIKHLDDPDAIQRILTEYEQNGTLSKCLDAKDNHGDALVHFVARAHSLPVLQLLRQYNADLEAVNEHGRQPIHEAIDSLECVTFLARVCKVNVDALKRGDWTPLMIAALKGRLDIIQELDRAGCRLDLANKDGRTALHLAAQNGHVLACKYLAERCPESILKKTRSGRLPIQISAAYTDDPKAALDMTRMLFSLAKVPTQQLLQHRDNSGRSVLQDAAVSRNMELLRYIVDCGGNPNDPDALGRNVIHHLAMLGHWDVLRTLDSLVPCDWDTPDAWDEWTPLMHAARQGHLAVTKFLVETGRADPAKQDKHGRSSKQLAETWRHGAIVEYLESL